MTIPSNMDSDLERELEKKFPYPLYPCHDCSCGCLNCGSTYHSLVGGNYLVYRCPQLYDYNTEVARIDELRKHYIEEREVKSVTRINITKTSKFCMICGKEIKEDKYCEVVFESGHKLETHRRCAVEFTIQMREALEKEGVLE